MDHKIQSTTNNTTATVPTANETPAIEYEEESIATVDDDDDNNNKDDNDDDANQPLPPPPVALPDTPIPTKQRKKVTIAPSMETISSIKNNNSNIIIHNNHLHDQNQNKEAKLQKIVSRVVFGACMFSVFLLLVRTYLCDCCFSTLGNNEGFVWFD